MKRRPMPDRHRVRITPRAADDMAGICSYIQQKSPQNAVRVAQTLVDAVDSLAVFPGRYKVHEYRRDPAKTVRSMPVPPFIIYYRVIARIRAVEILTIRHGSRRQPRRFR